MKPEKLVTMANQIGAFFASQKGDEAVHGIADHLKKFWNPGMREALFAYAKAGGEGLDLRVRRAVEQLSRERGDPPKC
jgi:formate dehydrogenase subunit delta